MTGRATFTLDDDAFAFLKAAAGRNRSAYINRLLKEEQRRALTHTIARANREEAEDEAYQAELAAWDAALLDGLRP
jgi:hypothetical protein